MQHNSTFPIKQNELNMLRDEATSYLKSIQWEQSQRAKNRDNDGKDESILLYLSRANNGSNVSVTSVSKTILSLKRYVANIFLYISYHISYCYYIF